jgi:hypothetical protein
MLTATKKTAAEIEAIIAEALPGARAQVNYHGVHRVSVEVFRGAPEPIARACGQSESWGRGPIEIDLDSLIAECRGSTGQIIAVGSQGWDAVEIDGEAFVITGDTGRDPVSAEEGQVIRGRAPATEDRITVVCRANRWIDVSDAVAETGWVS